MALKKTSILVVEDEGIVAMNMKLSLLGMGFEVLPIAISGPSAIDIASRTRPDVVLMDIRLRGKMDGVQTAEAIAREHGVPVIYVTAHTDEETVERARRTNPSALLRKPVSDIELKSAIMDALKNNGK